MTSSLNPGVGTARPHTSLQMILIVPVGKAQLGREMNWLVVVRRMPGGTGRPRPDEQFTERRGGARPRKSAVAHKSRDEAVPAPLFETAPGSALSDTGKPPSQNKAGDAPKARSRRDGDIHRFDG